MIAQMYNYIYNYERLENIFCEQEFAYKLFFCRIEYLGSRGNDAGDVCKV